jgi:hypothetical protein
VYEDYVVVNAEREQLSGVFVTDNSILLAAQKFGRFTTLKTKSITRVYSSHVE